MEDNKESRVEVQFPDIKLECLVPLDIIDRADEWLVTWKEKKLWVELFDGFVGYPSVESIWKGEMTTDQLCAFVLLFGLKK